MRGPMALSRVVVTARLWCIVGVSAFSFAEWSAVPGNEFLLPIAAAAFATPAVALPVGLLFRFRRLGRLRDRGVIVPRRSGVIVAGAGGPGDGLRGLPGAP